MTTKQKEILTLLLETVQEEAVSTVNEKASSVVWLRQLKADLEVELKKKENLILPLKETQFCPEELMKVVYVGTGEVYKLDNEKLVTFLMDESRADEVKKFFKITLGDLKKNFDDSDQLILDFEHPKKGVKKETIKVDKFNKEELEKLQEGRL